MGALPQLYAATDPNVESGQFIDPTGRPRTRATRRQSGQWPPPKTRRVPTGLWKLSEELTGVRFVPALSTGFGGSGRLTEHPLIRAL